MTPGLPPRLSIGMPVYNGLPFLEDALRSLLNQTYTDFELLILDNASDDGSFELCRDYARRDDRIRVIRHTTNLGAAENFNQAFRLATGTYFKWATADDCCQPGLLASCIRRLDADLDIALCYPKTQLIDESGQDGKPYEDRLNLSERSAYRRFDALLRRIDLANAVFGVFRRQVLEETQLIGNYPMSDLVLLAEVALRGQFYEYPERLFFRRMHRKQSTQQYKNRQDRAQWFQPGRPRGRYFPCWRVLLEFCRAVQQAPLSSVEKAACLASVRHWPRRYWKDHIRDLRGGLKRMWKQTSVTAESPVEAAEQPRRQRDAA